MSSRNRFQKTTSSLSFRLVGALSLLTVGGLLLAKLDRVEAAVVGTPKSPAPAMAAAKPAAPSAAASDAPGYALFGHGLHRNMFDPKAKNVPDDWDPASGRNIKWVATLGSQSYAGPLLYRNMVFVGTNNEAKKNPKLTGDRGNLMAFDLATGELIWQSAYPKLASGRVNDWPLQGVCSTPHVEVMWFITCRIAPR